MGVYFDILCPINDTKFNDPFFLFNNGSQKNEMNFKDVCPIKQKPQFARITFNQGVNLLVDKETDEMVETGKWDVSNTLLRSGVHSMILRDWELLKLFFNVYNINPIWLPGNSSKGDGLYDHQKGHWSGPAGKVEHKKNSVCTLLFDFRFRMEPQTCLWHHGYVKDMSLRMVLGILPIEHLPLIFYPSTSGQDTHYLQQECGIYFMSLTFQHMLHSSQFFL